MMNIVSYPIREHWSQLLARPVLDSKPLQEKVLTILHDVQQNGDEAVRRYTHQFDGVLSESLQLTNQEMNAAATGITDDLKTAIKQAAANIRAFHEKQVTPPETIETMPGIQCWRKSIGIEKVGLYIPGGTAPLFSTILMLGIPAVIAGCKEIIVCSPPRKDGSLHPAIIFAAQCVGITKIFKAGGVQAIAAMAYGTETIPRVYKIFGPGNQYVTCAKQLVQQEGVAIDMPAGPSEVCILADETANPAFVAADLLSQAEHGTDSQVLLVSADVELVTKIIEEINKQVVTLLRKDIAQKALENSRAIIVHDINEGIDLVNEYAAEHLIIACANEETVAGQITNAGSVFIGQYSPESVGDYASGTNHTLPTNGFAKAYSGVSVDSFVKKITYQKLSRDGLQKISKTVVCMAEAEGLQAHAEAVNIRLHNAV